MNLNKTKTGTMIKYKGLALSGRWSIQLAAFLGSFYFPDTLVNMLRLKDNRKGVRNEAGREERR